MILKELSFSLEIDYHRLINAFILISDLFVNGRINHFATIYSYLPPLSLFLSFKIFGKEMESFIRIYDDRYRDGLFFHLPDFQDDTVVYISIMTRTFPKTNEKFEWLCKIHRPLRLVSNCDIVMKGTSRFWRFNYSDLRTYASYLDQFYTMDLDQLYQRLIDLE
jgi:hypothetical protein